MFQSRAGVAAARVAIISLTSSTSLYAAPAAAADGTVELLPLTCTPSLDRQECRAVLSQRIIEIERGQIAAQANAYPAGKLRAQSVLTQAAVAEYDAWLSAQQDCDSKHSAAEAAQVYLDALNRLTGTVAGASQSDFQKLQEDQAKVTQQQV
jgi:hypothetical protein